MKLRSMCSQLVLVCLFAGLAAYAQAQESQAQRKTDPVVPQLIKFSGTLFDQHMQPTESPVGVTFALYAQQSGGAALWLETQNVEVDAKGNYTALIGANSSHGVPMELFTSGEARWLGVQSERQPEQPRVLLVSVPYALKAGDAETLGGKPATAFALAKIASDPSIQSSFVVPVAQSSAPVPFASVGVTTAGGTVNRIAKFDASTDLANSMIFDNGISVGIANTSPAATLDVSGSGIFRGSLQLPSTGTANGIAVAGFNSQPFDLVASAWNTSTKFGVGQHFRWQAEPISNTSTPGGKLNLLFASGTVAPAETGLSISNKGIITFAPGQTLPAVSGNETVTGNMSAAQLISTVATGTAPLSVKSTTVVPNLNAGLLGGHPSGAYALLAASNTFTASQTVNGSVTATGNLAVGGNLGIGTSSPLTTLDVAGFQRTLIGNTGCGGNFGGIGFGALSLSNCLNYSLLGEGVNTYLNRPAGGDILFRENNTPQMILASGGNVGIGTASPNYPLHVNGTIRAETGLSMGGSSTLSIDAPGKVGGQFLVTNGTVSIGGDTPMSSNPHMTFTAAYLGSLCQGVQNCGGGSGRDMGAFTPDKNILITRVTITLDPISTSCGPAAVHFSDYTLPIRPPLPSIPIPAGVPRVDSGPLTIAVAAGRGFNVVTQLNSGGSSCSFGASAGGDVWIIVNYVMQ